MKVIQWLQAHKRWNVLIVVLYYLAVVLPHVTVGQFINGFFESYDRATYNLIIAGLTAVSVIVGILMLRKKLVWHPEQKTVILYLLSSILFALACFTILFVINVEAIHFLQYAILAVILYPLLGSFRSVMALAVFLGATDELYQYLVLDTAAHYFDFNDVWFDTIGAGYGVLFLKIMGCRTPAALRSQWYLRLGFLLVTVTAICLGILALLGVFSVNPIPDDPAYFTLFKQAPSGFWTYPKGPYSKFHILTPIPGLILIFATAYFYGLLDRIKPLVVSG